MRGGAEGSSRPAKLGVRLLVAPCAAAEVGLGALLREGKALLGVAVAMGPMHCPLFGKVKTPLGLGSIGASEELATPHASMAAPVACLLGGVLPLSELLDSCDHGSKRPPFLRVSAQVSGVGSARANRSGVG